MTIIVRNVEGVWQRLAGIHTLTRMVETYIAKFADGTEEEMHCDPYPVEEVLNINTVARLLETGVWGDTELASYGLRVAIPFAVPEGEQIVGAASYGEVGDEIVETYTTEPIPPQPYQLYKSTLVDRMHDGSEPGTVDEAAILETAVAQAPSKLRQKYQASDFFMSDDPMFAVLEQTIAAALGDAQRAAQLLVRPVDD